MKVLYTTNIPSPYRIKFFNELAKECELTVVFERNDAKNREKKWLNSEKINFDIKHLNGIKVGNDSAICFSIIEYIKKNRFDIIVVGGYSTPTGMILINYLKLKKIPFILNCDGGFIKDDNTIKYKIKKYFISSASAYLSTGKHTTEYLQYYGANKSNIYNYPFTSISEEDIINTNANIDKVKIKEKLKIKEKKVILSIGQIINRKGFDLLIKAMKAIDNDDAGLYIVGGKSTKEYNKLIEDLMLKNVHFVGFKQKNELYEYYSVADVFAFATREDIWGLVINEAMSMGLPVVTTDRCIAGMELIKNDVNGYIVKTENVQELANSIKKILNDNKLKEYMSNNNINKIRKYTIENMAKEHLKIFKEIIRKNKK